MDPALMRLFGSCLEVLGAFLLAIEAIKLHNLRFIRERVLEVVASKVNPVVHFVNANSDEEKKQSVDWINIVFTSFILLGLLIIYGLVRLLGLDPRDAWGTFSGFVPGPLWIDILVALPAGFLLLLISSFVGYGTYALVVLALGTAIAALNFIERHTATGVVGIMGFLLFLAGVMLKAYLDWVGA